MVVPVTSGLISNLVAAGQNTPVSTWSDSSPAHTGNAVSDGSPLATRIDNATPTGGPAIHFTESSYLHSNIGELDSSTSAEFFAVVRDNGTYSNAGFYQLGGNDRMVYGQYFSYTYDGSFTNGYYTIPQVSVTNWHVYNVSHDGTTRTTRIDGVVVHSAAAPFVAPSATDYSTWRVSRSGWMGDIAEMATYKRSLTDTERTQVYDYLKAAHLQAAVVAPLVLPPISFAVSVTPASASAPAVAPLTLPPIAVVVTLVAGQAAESQQINLPPIGVQISMQSTETGDALALPPIRVAITVLSPALRSISLTLSTPADQDTLATATPAFVVAVMSDDDEAVYTLEVQYAADSTFTSPVSLSDDFAAVDGGAVLTATAPVPATTYWRARLLQGAEVIVDYTPARSFTVNTTVAASTLPITWAINASADAPAHLWHLNPAGPSIGDTVTVYGQGFGTTGTLSFGDTSLEVGSWELVAATDDNDSDDTRRIDDDVVTCEHYEITFVAPTYDGPGAALTVEA